MENEYPNNSFQPEEIPQKEPRGPQFDDSGATDSLYTKLAAGAKTNGWGASVRSFVRNNRATLLPLVALLAAITLGLGAVVVLDDDSAPLQLSETGVSEEVREQEAAPQQDDNEVRQDTSVVTSDAFTSARANVGEGITHLARRVLAQELTNAGTTLSAEQLVYAEDYLQNRTGTYGLEVGQEVSFNATDIADAIEGAQALQDWQLENLQHYTV